MAGQRKVFAATQRGARAPGNRARALPATAACVELNHMAQGAVCLRHARPFRNHVNWDEGEEAISVDVT